MFGEAGAGPQETVPPWPTPTRLAPPSPTPRATVATPIGASDLRSFDSKGSFTTKDTKNTKFKQRLFVSLVPFVVKNTWDADDRVGRAGAAGDFDRGFRVGRASVRVAGGVGGVVVFGGVEGRLNH